MSANMVVLDERLVLMHSLNSSGPKIYSREQIAYIFQFVEHWKTPNDPFSFTLWTFVSIPHKASSSMPCTVLTLWDWGRWRCHCGTEYSPTRNLSGHFPCRRQSPVSWAPVSLGMMIINTYREKCAGLLRLSGSIQLSSKEVVGLWKLFESSAQHDGLRGENQE